MGWVGTFPGVINIGTTYKYETFNVHVGGAQFIQIDFDSIVTSTFVSAYQTSYAPDSAGPPNFGFDINWLGDAGTSGNFFGTDPLFFNVIAQPNSNLVVVVNETTGDTGPASGIGKPFHLTVEAFYDTNFSETPEPSAILLCLGGLAILFGRRGSKKAVAAAVIVAGFGTAIVASAQDISDSAFQQIRALLLEKQSRTAVQHKLSSPLVYAANAARGFTIEGITDLGNPATTLQMGPGGALVRINATVSADLLNTIQQLGGRVIYANAARGSIKARLPVNFIEALAARGDVRAISASFLPKLNGESMVNLMRHSRSPLLGIGRIDARPFHLGQFLGIRTSLAPSARRE